MLKILYIVNKKLMFAIPVMMGFGLIFGSSINPDSISHLKFFIIPLTFLMVYPMMVTLNFAHLKQGVNIRLQGIAQLINFGIIPFVSFLLGKLFFSEQPFMALGLLLASLLPTSGMTISWTGFAKGNMSAAINMAVIGLTLGSIATPFYLNWLMGATVAVDLVKVLQQILVIIFLPMGLGYVTRKKLLQKYGQEAFKKQVAPLFPALSTIGVLGIVFVAMALKAKTILGTPEILLSIFIPLLLLYTINFFLSTIVGKLFFNRGEGIALVYGTVMRNLSIALAIAINGFGDEGTNAALVISLAYVIQVQSAAWYVKFTDTIFGPVE